MVYVVAVDIGGFALALSTAVRLRLPALALTLTLPLAIGLLLRPWLSGLASTGLTAHAALSTARLTALTGLVSATALLLTAARLRALTALTLTLLVLVRMSLLRHFATPENLKRLAK